MGSAPAANAKGLAGVSMLLVTADIGARERLSRALRAAGVEVAERRHGPAPAVDVLLIDSATEARMRKDLDLITGDVRMRWSSVVRYEFAQAAPVGAAPDLSGVEKAVSPALAADRSLAERLRGPAASPVELQLAPLGPIRILRVAAASGRTLHVRFQSHDVRVDCDLADGLLVCAFAEGVGGEREGGLALAPLLDMDPARVTITSRERPAAVNIMEPVDQALELAALERQSLLQPPDNDTALPAPREKNADLSITNPAGDAAPPAAPVAEPRLAVGDAKKKFNRTMMGGVQLPAAGFLGGRSDADKPDDALARAQQERATVAATHDHSSALETESPTAPPPAAAPAAPVVAPPRPKPASQAKSKTLFGVGAPRPPSPKGSGTGLPPIDPALDATLGDEAHADLPAPVNKKRNEAAFAGTQLAMPAPPPPAVEDDGLPPAIEDDGLPPAIEDDGLPPLIGADDSDDALARAEEERATQAVFPADPLPPEPSREELSVASALQNAIADMDADDDAPSAQEGPPAPPPEALAKSHGAAPPPPPPAAVAASGRKRRTTPSGSRRRWGLVAAVVLVAGVGTALWMQQSQAPAAEAPAPSPAPATAAAPKPPAAKAPPPQPAAPGKQPASAVEPAAAEPAVAAQPESAPEPAAAAARKAEQPAAAAAPEPEPPRRQEPRVEEKAPRAQASAVAAERDENGRDQEGSDEAVAAGLRAERGGNLGEAMQLYERGVELDPRNPRAYAGKARVYLAQGDGTEALEAAIEAVQLRRRRASYRVLMGDALRAVGKQDEAQGAYRKALELDPDDADAAARLR